MRVKVSLGVASNKWIGSHGPVRNRKRALLPATSPKFRSIGRTVSPGPITRRAPPAISNVRASSVAPWKWSDVEETIATKSTRGSSLASLWPRLSSTAGHRRGTAVRFPFLPAVSQSRLSSSPLLSSSLLSIHPFQLHTLLNHISLSRQLFRY